MRPTTKENFMPVVAFAAKTVVSFVAIAVIGEGVKRAKDWKQNRAEPKIDLS